MGVPNNLLNLQ